jgi:hypothetical protein
VRAGLAQAEADTAGNTRLISTCASTTAAAGTWRRPRRGWRRRARPSPSRAWDRALALAHVPDPDLLIRTGGEQRLQQLPAVAGGVFRALFQRQAVARVRRRRARRGPGRLRRARAPFRQDLRAGRRRRPRRRPERAAMLKQRIITASSCWPSCCRRCSGRRPSRSPSSPVLIAAGAWEWGR